MAGQNLSLFPEKVIEKCRLRVPNLQVCGICRTVYRLRGREIACSRECSLLLRFWASVEKTETCWVWRGPLRATGYGYLQHGEHSNKWAAHRFSYVLHRGPVPDGYVLDHLCRNRACVNPEHLEVVTERENILRGEGLAAQNAKKTHCKRGHVLDDANVYIDKRGSRHCRRCQKSNDDAFRERQRLAWMSDGNSANVTAAYKRTKYGFGPSYRF